MYPQAILDHYNNPRNEGVLMGFTHVDKAENLNCGDSCKIFLKVNKNQIEDIAHQSEGCAICVATASLLTEQLKGRSIGYAQEFSQEQTLALLGVNIKESRQGCALLPLQAIKQALAT